VTPILVRRILNGILALDPPIGRLMEVVRLVKTVLSKAN
jgi:hypothetical protein